MVKDSRALRTRPTSPGVVGPLVKRVEARIVEEGGARSEWVVGVAEDPERALFEGHRVDPRRVPFVWVQADTPIAARAVAHYFHAQGCLGRAKWSDLACCVFAYRRGPGTWP